MPRRFFLRPPFADLDDYGHELPTTAKTQAANDAVSNVLRALGAVPYESRAIVLGAAVAYFCIRDDDPSGAWLGVMVAAINRMQLLDPEDKSIAGLREKAFDEMLAPYVEHRRGLPRK